MTVWLERYFLLPKNTHESEKSNSGSVVFQISCTFTISRRFIDKCSVITGKWSIIPVRTLFSVTHWKCNMQNWSIKSWTDSINWLQLFCILNKWILIWNSSKFRNFVSFNKRNCAVHVFDLMLGARSCWRGIFWRREMWRSSRKIRTSRARNKSFSTVSVVKF